MFGRSLGLLIIAAMAAGTARAQTNIDPAHEFAWGENIGWTNWPDAGNPVGALGVRVEDTFLSGLIWAENVGWISVGNGAPANGVHYANVNGADFGVNRDPNTDELFGYAWGENIGWVNFDTAGLGADQAAFDACTHRFFGYAWGENVGWINLADATHFVAVGPCQFGDHDCDGDIDIMDGAAFVDILGGPDAPVDCPAFDFDGDADVDLADFASFQAAFTGG